MLCDFDRIDALAAGELPAEERVSVLAHMENCPACRAYYEAMAGLEGEETAPAGFTGRVMDAVRATPQVKVRRRSVWQGVAAMAACAALVVGLGLSSGLLSAGKAPAEGADAAEMSRSDDGEGAPAGEGAELAGYGDQATDLPLTVHTLTDAALCQQVRAWLALQGIGQLYPDGPREAYDLTLAQVQALNAAVPAAALPELTLLQLELKSAE